MGRQTDAELNGVTVPHPWRGSRHRRRRCRRRLPAVLSGLSEAARGPGTLHTRPRPATLVFEPARSHCPQRPVIYKTGGINTKPMGGVESAFVKYRLVVTFAPCNITHRGQVSRDACTTGPAQLQHGHQHEKHFSKEHQVGQKAARNSLPSEKPPGTQLGFNIRGGKPSQPGIFISKVIPDSDAHWTSGRGQSPSCETWISKTLSTARLLRP
ncbi:hypothetical protein GH733_015361 [Mirounga leonina]|nr:hypothetical protein GH733_015361 [Mirounga leonina]